MEQQEFLSALTAAGFKEIVTVQREPNGSLDVHTHPFEAKALILSGAIWIRSGETEQLYEPGHVFHLAADAPHSERYGPQGVTYMVGRR